MSDLIIKGAGEIKDGLYNIKDGKLFKYKANGGTVRTYPIVSADRPTGHWIKNDNGTFSCSNCQSWIPEEQHHYARYCLYCGARMESEEE